MTIESVLGRDANGYVDVWCHWYLFEREIKSSVELRD